MPILISAPSPSEPAHVGPRNQGLVFARRRAVATALIPAISDREEEEDEEEDEEEEEANAKNAELQQHGVDRSG